MSERLRDLPEIDWTIILAPTHFMDVLDAACALHGRMSPRSSGKEFEDFWKYLGDDYGFTPVGRTWKSIADAFEAGEIGTDATPTEIAADKLSGVKNLNKRGVFRWAVDRGYVIPDWVLEKLGNDTSLTLAEGAEMLSVSEAAKLLADKCTRDEKYWIKVISKHCTMKKLGHVGEPGSRRIRENDLWAWFVHYPERLKNVPIKEAFARTLSKF